jgi:hypothetical protein
MKSPAAGAATSIHLASSPAVEGVSGAFFARNRPRKSNPLSYDVAAARRLWQVSGNLVGLDAN